MSKKQRLSPDTIANELRGHSAFFPSVDAPIPSAIPSDAAPAPAQPILPPPLPRAAAPLIDPPSPADSIDAASPRRVLATGTVDERKNERSHPRRKVRHTFDIY